VVVLLSIAHLAHVESTNPAYSIILVDLCRGLALCLGKNYVQEIFGCGDNRDTFEVVHDHGEGWKGWREGEGRAMGRINERTRAKGSTKNEARSKNRLRAHHAVLCVSACVRTIRGLQFSQRYVHLVMRERCY
jgi:hypothetical protein